MTEVGSEGGELLSVELLSVEQARELTDNIRTALSVTWEWVTAAYYGRAWLVLGYATWDQYTALEFGADHLRLPREERTAAIASLRAHGVSLRGIAAVTGVSQATVHSDLKGAQNGAPETGVPAVTRGRDGKTYPARGATPLDPDGWLARRLRDPDRRPLALPALAELLPEDVETVALMRRDWGNLTRAYGYRDDFRAMVAEWFTRLDEEEGGEYGPT